MNKEKKTEFIHVRVTKKEKESLTEKAGKNISKLIRKLIGLD
jgi:hypothetical protein